MPGLGQVSKQDLSWRFLPYAGNMPRELNAPVDGLSSSGVLVTSRSTERRCSHGHCSCASLTIGFGIDFTKLGAGAGASAWTPVRERRCSQGHRSFASMASGVGFGFAKLGAADPAPASVRLAARCTERRCSQGHCSSAVVVSVREGVAVVATTDGLVIAIMLETLPPESGSGSQLSRVETKAKPGADGGSRSRKASTTGVSGFGMDVGSALSVEPGRTAALTSIGISVPAGMVERCDLVHVFSPQRSHVLQPLSTICCRETSVTLTSV